VSFLLFVEQPVSDRNDAALFEEVLWQPTAEEAETELDEPHDDVADADKGLLELLWFARRHLNITEFVQTWKFLEFKTRNFQAWKVCEKTRILESP